MNVIQHLSEQMQSISTDIQSMEQKVSLLSEDVTYVEKDILSLQQLRMYVDNIVADIHSKDVDSYTSIMTIATICMLTNLFLQIIKILIGYIL